MINGVTKLFITKADVLSGFKTVKVCVGYIIDGKETSEVPFEHDAIISPVYLEFPGWNENISDIRDYEGLPDAFKKYIGFVEEQTGDQ